ncbi:MAG: hypothetical protein V4639_20425 [Pseudomonadota bacterium]
MDANLDAQVKLLPSRSQVFVILLALLSGLAFIVGCLFLWHEKPSSWVPFMFALFFGVPAGAAWLLSHKNTDLDGAHPTKVVLTENGIQIETDSRTLASRQPFQQLEKIIGIAGHRVPLPEPDGLVSELGLPIPTQKAEAIERVNRANEEATRATMSAVKFLCNPNGASDENGTIEAPMSLPANVAALSMNKPEEGLKLSGA